MSNKVTVIVCLLILIFIVFLGSVLFFPFLYGCSDEEYLCCDDVFPLTYTCEPCEDCCKGIQDYGMGDAAASEDNTFLNCPEHCNCSNNIGERCQKVFKVYNQNKCNEYHYHCNYEGKPKNENIVSYTTRRWCKKCKDMEKDFHECKAKIQVNSSPTWKDNLAAPFGTV